MQLNNRYFKCLTVASLVVCTSIVKAQNTDALLLQHVNLIDGTGAAAQKDVDVLIANGKFENIGKNLPNGTAKEVNFQGMTIMPALISDHVHIGNVKGVHTDEQYYTRENILQQLNQYQNYGVENILVMGTDRRLMLQSGLKDSSENGLINGARWHSAAIGFGVPQGAPPLKMGMNMVFRPNSTDEVKADMDTLIPYNPLVVKLWVDDFGGKFPKMKPEIYKKIINQAHAHGWRAAAHVYYLSDARQLVNDGVDILGHSVRDSVIDDDLVALMKEKNVVYIPTLSLDEFAYIYSRKPEWIDDGFFKASISPEVYAMITSKEYQDQIKNSPDYQKNINAFQTALKNLKKLHDAGILIAFGTDSGAMPIRAQGFSEHLELQLMVEAGLSPLEAIKVATLNSASVLKMDNQYGSIQKGKTADFIVLSQNPTENIKNTRSIINVYKAGKLVSFGPLKK